MLDGNRQGGDSLDEDYLDEGERLAIVDKIASFRGAMILLGLFIISFYIEKLIFEEVA